MALVKSPISDSVIEFNFFTSYVEFILLKLKLNLLFNFFTGDFFCDVSKPVLLVSSFSSLMSFKFCFYF